ncbi:Holliday junction branch migration DNA helicase RuvB [bacterium]|nr:Holliday junction branch migration DNA helicase RuvB [bacterium]
MSRVTTYAQLNEDKKLDNALRPKSFNEYVGQEKIKNNLKILIEAAKKRSEAIEHILLYGNPGLGKTSLAYIIANELNSNIRITSGPAIEKAGDLAAILTNLNQGDILFFDEFHRLNKTLEEILYPALEDFKLDVVIGKGPSARTLQIDLPRFTLIAATTRIGLISSPLRNRFGITFHLNFYPPSEIKKIIKRSADLLNIQIENEAAEIISNCSRFTPRVANRLLKRVRDYAQVKGDGVITKEIAKQALEMLEIDHLGLEPTDRYILETIIEKFDGGPVGISALSAATNEEKDAIEEIYEPYLMKLGLLTRTPKGRIVTKLAYKHLNIKYSNNVQSKLW